MLRILLDRRIPWGREAFADLGEVHEYDVLSPRELGAAEVLVFRSSTRIDADLLAQAPNLQVLATPVIGLDHIDMQALNAHRARTGRPLPLFHAPGSTAGGVADFALAAICHLAQAVGLAKKSLTVGIVGYGNCGRALAWRLDRMGMRHLAYDPPLQAREPHAFSSASLEEVLRCDAVSLHVPLTTPSESPWPTWRMFNEQVLFACPPILVNTARGAVIDPKALMKAIDSGRIVAALDVWEGEPEPEADLVQRAALATPHVAGSVIEGRMRAVAMVREAVCAALRLQAPPWKPEVEPPRSFTIADIGIAALSDRFKSAYLSVPPQGRGAVFEAVRASAMRHEVRW